jgi:N-acetylmuramoyl-L-alanine amidase
MIIIPRAGWGFTGWAIIPHTAAPSARWEWMIHHDGATPVTRTGPAVPRAIDAEHKARGWAGIGYNWVIDQDGTIFEGRGWDLVGAHCPDHNTRAFGVQVAIGGDQQPSPAALVSARALYQACCRRVGRTLTPLGHRDGRATECPGAVLYSWVHHGMPTTAEDDVQLSDTIKLGPYTTDAYASTGAAGVTQVSVEDALNVILGRAIRASQHPTVDVDALAEALAPKLADTGYTLDELRAALAEVLPTVRVSLA